GATTDVLWGDVTTPDATPDSATDARTPDSATPDSATPDSATPDSATPDSATPDTTIDSGPDTTVDSAAAVILTSSHTGWSGSWRNKNCYTSGCHTSTALPSLHDTTWGFPECAACHGANGACDANGGSRVHTTSEDCTRGQPRPHYERGLHPMPWCFRARL
ncbi:MAG: hypothetical protein JRH20_23095, partial [Deltaproteobacteria bacterium]|nr:hypothetical protein [Deltaproteobacteria bacterium]